MFDHPTAVLSYARMDVDAPADKAAVLQVVDGLERQVHAVRGGRDFELWRDINGIRTGEAWREALFTAIGRAQILVVLLSPGWVRSDECWREFETFCARPEFARGQITVYPALLRDVSVDGLTADQQARFATLSAIQRADWRTLVAGPVEGRPGVLARLLHDTARDLSEILGELARAESKTRPDRLPNPLPTVVSEALSEAKPDAGPENEPERETGTAEPKVGTESATRDARPRTTRRRLMGVGAGLGAIGALVGVTWVATRRDPRELRVLRGHELPVPIVAFSPDGQQIVSGSGDNTLRLWDAESGTEVAVLRGHEHWVRSVAFSPDGQRIASGSVDGTLRLWDGSSGAEVAVLRGHEGSVNSVAFSPDGRRIVSGGEDDTLRLWDAESGAVVAVLRGHESWMWSVAFSPDGRRIVSGSEDDTLRLWDGSSGAEVAVLRGHELSVLSVAFSPDGRRIVSGSSDRTLRLWDAESGVEVAVLRGHERAVFSVAFSPDGRRIVSGSLDCTLRLWDAVPDDV